MRYTKKELYELLPAIYRQHDAKIGKPLEALIGVIAEQVEILEDDIQKLYDNWFIETCEEWIVPYIGDLVGAKLLITTEKARVSHRAWVANTIRYRRGKGTVAILEQVARDVTNWNAKAVEFFQLLSTTQNVNHIRPANVRTPDIREEGRLELLDTPFDTIPHTVDVRNIRSGPGYHNIPNIGLFLWRLQAYPVDNAPAFPHGDGKYSFNQLGIETLLFNHPITEPTITHLAEEINVPAPIRRRMLRDNLEEYYGKGKSILIAVDSETKSADDIVVCDLSNWDRPSAGKVAVDPVLGRIAFPINKKPESVRVKYYYGFSADVGGGFYNRGVLEDIKKELKIDLTDIQPYRISYDESKGDYKSITDAITQWKKDNRPNAIFEIMDSEFYTESFELTGDQSLLKNRFLIIRAAEEQRPLLQVDPAKESAEQLIKVSGEEGSKLVLEGLIIDQSIKITSGDLDTLYFSHCTLVPRKRISLELNSENDNLSVTFHRSISGKICMTGSEAELILRDSIVDGKTEKKDDINSDYDIESYKATIETSTIFGKVKVDLLELASNAIFTDLVIAKRRQDGCVRFSYIPNGSKVPRCYRCQPESVASIIKPRFTSEKYGDPGYAQLHKDIAKEIFEGADNEAEMGVFNHLYQPQRIKNLESSLDEYLRFGLEAGILLVDVRREDYEGGYH